MSDNALAIFGSDTAELPAHLQDAIKNDGNMGNEGVSADDQAIPRISLLQGLSPQIDDVEGARPGLFHNSITNEMPDELIVINLAFRKEWAVFKKKELGGGFQGAYETKEAADAHIETLPGSPADYQLIETAKHALLILDPETGKAQQPAEMFFKSSALNSSRKWNSDLSMRNQGAPRFATVWKMTAQKKKNDKGTWYVPATQFMGFAPTELYEEAKSWYESISAQ